MRSRCVVWLALALAPAIARAEPHPAHDAIQRLVKSRLLGSLDGFLTQFADTRFAGVVRLGDREALHRAFGHRLDVVLDTRLDVQGRYESGDEPGSMSNLRVATSRPPAGDPTLWHESMHHLIQRLAPQDCLEEEAYMEACERRITWLAGVRAYERLVAQHPGITAAKRRRSWALREAQWRDQRLSGPFEWTNAGEDRTCDSSRRSVTLDAATLRRLDALIGFDIDPARVKSLYFPEN